MFQHLFQIIKSLFLFCSFAELVKIQFYLNIEIIKISEEIFYICDFTVKDKTGQRYR